MYRQESLCSSLPLAVRLPAAIQFFISFFTRFHSSVLSHTDLILSDFPSRRCVTRSGVGSRIGDAFAGIWYCG